MGPDSKHSHSSKSDDELLSRAAERASPEPEAQTALWAELKRRKVPFRAQNLSFKTIPMIGYGLVFVCCVALGVKVYIVMNSHELLKFALAVILVWGTIFAAIAWATRRALRGRP